MSDMSVQLVHLECVCESGALLRLVPGVGRLLLDLASRTQHLLAPGLPQSRGRPPAHVTRDTRHNTRALHTLPGGVEGVARLQVGGEPLVLPEAIQAVLRHYLGVAPTAG